MRLSQIFSKQTEGLLVYRTDFGDHTILEDKPESEDGRMFASDRQGDDPTGGHGIFA